MLIVMLLVSLASRANWYYGVYYDYKTSSLLSTSFAIQLLQEQKAGEYLEDILKSYGKVIQHFDGVGSGHELSEGQLSRLKESLSSIVNEKNQNSLKL